MCKVQIWTGSGTPNLQGVKMFHASDRRGCFEIGENLYSSMYEIRKVHLTVCARMVRKVKCKICGALATGFAQYQLLEVNWIYATTLLGLASVSGIY